ncbi:MAG TPA: tail fiber domain-containing protein [Bryobacteraceae bacterium]|nr:tail fiber domain-containing protein [Bryobacteraceae bacterium]
MPTLPANAVPLVFVAMTPCRVVDTRASQGFPAPFGAPPLVAGASRTSPLQSSTLCSIPAAAQAYSLNFTVVPAGPTGFLTAYPSGKPLPLAATLVWSGGALTSNAAVVPGGTNDSIDVYANIATEVVIDINGYYGSASGTNTAFGIGALSSNTTGLDNTAVGAAAMSQNTTGFYNAAFGNRSMLSATTGSGNTAVGDDAMAFSGSGSNNTAIGFQALPNNGAGNNNIAIGVVAGSAVTAGNNNNDIGNQGASSDNNVIRIGDPMTQSSFFATGIRGVATGSNNAIPIVIDSNGQLGTVSSSRRFKEAIQDMGDASRAILDLRPVTFRYRTPFDDGSKPIQYGLVAEEVADVFPDLVARSADGQIETVKYQVLDALLLHELHRQEAEIRALKERLVRLETALAPPSQLQ